MDSKVLKKDLNSNPRTINIFGAEELYRKEAINILIKHYIEKGTEDFNINFISEETDKEINTILQESPFSSNFRIVFLKEAFKFLSYRSDTTILVSLDNSLEKPHYSIDCSRVYGRKLKAIIKAKAKNLGLDFDKEDIDLFISLNGNNLLVLESELSKLELLGEKSIKILKELSSSNIKSRLDVFFNALIIKDSSSVSKSIFKLKNSGVIDSQLYGFFVYSLKNLLLVSSLPEDKLEDYDLYKMVKYKNQLEEQFVVEIFKYLTKLDFLFKNNSFPFIIFAISICRRNFILVDNYIKFLDNEF